MSYYDSYIFEMESKMLNQAFECLEKTHRQRMTAIEYGDGIYPFTMEAVHAAIDEEMVVYTEGVKDLWNKFVATIKSMIGKILDMIAPNRRKQEPPKEVTVEADPEYTTNCMNKLSGILGRIADVTGEDGQIDPAKVAARLGIVVGASVTMSEVIKAMKEGHKKKKRVYKNGAAKKVADTMSSASSSLNQAVEGFSAQMNGSNALSAGAVAQMQSLVTAAVSMSAEDAKSLIGRSAKTNMPSEDVATKVMNHPLSKKHPLSTSDQAKLADLDARKPGSVNRFWDGIEQGIDKGLIDHSGELTKSDYAAIWNDASDSKIIDVFKVMKENAVEPLVDAPVFEFIDFENDISTTDTFSSIDKIN